MCRILPIIKFLLTNKDLHARIAFSGCAIIHSFKLIAREANKDQRDFNWLKMKSVNKVVYQAFAK